jgi:uncharacterized protein
MISKDLILSKIKNTVLSVEPDATLILYGSFARGDNRTDSDMDILILVNKEKTDWNENKKITSPLYDIELEARQVISPTIITKKDWEYKYFYTPLYANIKEDGIIL